MVVELILSMHLIERLKLGAKMLGELSRRSRVEVERKEGEMKMRRKRGGMRSSIRNYEVRFVSGAE